MLVKICGITNLEDARLAIDAGADALGFIFAPSKRRISPEKAHEIISQLPNKIRIAGVFRDETLENMIQIANFTRLSWLQLHGSESFETCQQLLKTYKVVKTVKVNPAGMIESAIDLPAWKLLLDTSLPGISGGTGRTFNWDVLSQFNPKNIFVAGGITPENIGTLLSRVRPFGIDLCSGVEISPGRKDKQKLQQLFKVINQFDLLPYTF
ncbi:phosphoribosylanthranilate isomerase [candidate division KSB1 bacterium]|nr:phosphoribosylanthranilate isomerase [candidate division KSB1 bacterium]